MAAAAQTEQDRAGHISFRKTELRRLCAIDRKHNSLQIVWLLNAHVHGAGDSTDLVGNRISHLLIRRLISPNDLNVVGSGESEVNRFAYDVGRKEVEDHPRKVAVKAETQVVHIISSRLMSGFQ